VTTTDELAQQALLLAALAKVVGQARDRVKQQLEQQMTIGDLKRPTISGVKAGSVTYSVGKTQVTIADGTAFTAWVEQNYVTELELITRVRPAFQDKVLEWSKVAGQPMGPGGELDVPGVVFRQSDPTLIVRPSTENAAELWAAARDQAIALAQPQPEQESAE
jgi:hypothetical protein